MTPPSTDLASTSRPQDQSLWFKAGGGTGALGIATGTIAAAVAAATGNTRPLAHFWTSVPMLVAYSFVALAVMFFFLGVAGCPFPMADGIKRQVR